jgi:homoserine O-succinyltransferase/O-acetyltransferase
MLSGTGGNMTWPAFTFRGDPGGDDDSPVVIGLVNNMPPKAMRTTERQFRDILRSAARGLAVTLELFTIHEDRTAGTAQPDASNAYRPLDELWPRRLDGLIVTGMEPRASSLPEEPAWPSLTRLVDWARTLSVPTVWSCLAAHAAVLHLDHIHRVPLPRKLSGLFSCTLVSASHPFATGVPGQWLCPHSRQNGLPEPALRGCGYEIISYSDEAGVDMFTHEGRAPFLFCQGHPEYGPDVLMREYVRDVKRFLDGDSSTLAELPTRYLDSETECRLAALRQDALCRRHDHIVAEMQDVARNATFVGGWQPVAIEVYANWLASIAASRRELAA